ncbi:TIGR02099 family protein [Stutzerimonas zhaodongensis]|uniref:TIGR02099 family protein n=1 Tax=Stutzerimonas zhaodongensis TaxID=1176257 RepID=A0A3M2HE10_9GAMM|nr:YhdP family protein [Stutzerimonas zhaodongensis]MCQ4318415.1 TIGR02099 family protein [Stutzerimonas zhaodongensis]RMH87986.1 TIGR02099 family protein [Stutzerimonas zhaodongensis]
MSQLLAFVLVFLRRSLWVAATCLMLLALYVSLGRLLVPLVAEYRVEVQEKAHELLDMPVALGRLEGHWEGFSPLIMAHDVMIGEADLAVRLDRLALVPDVVSSLLARKLQLSSVELTGVQLGLAQDGDGKWRVSGMPQRADEEPADLQKLFTGLQTLGDLRLLDSQITLEPNAAAPMTLTYANLQLRTAGERLRLDGGVLLPDGQPLSFRADARVEPADWLASNATLYLSLPQSDWAAWVPPSLIGDWDITQLKAGGELWLDWRAREMSRAVARFNAPALKFGHREREPVQIDDLSVTAYLDRAEDGYRLQLDDLGFTFEQERWRDTALLIEQHKSEDRWRLQTDRVAVAPLAKLIHALASLPDVANEYLLGLAPSGTLRNLQFDYRPSLSGAEQFAFAGNLDEVSIAEHNWIPGVRNVSGEVRGDLSGGELRFDNRDFTLHLAELFPDPWAYQRARGSLRWSLDDQAFTLAAPYLQVEGEEGHIAGDFLIRLMRDPGAEDYMDLRVGISDGDARFTQKYLPSRSPALSPALSEWLNSAIRGGTVEQGYFQYQGAISKSSDDAARSLSLYFKVRDAELAFQPGWPVLREGRAEVLIENSGVRVRVAEARMLDSRVHDATADIPRGRDNSVMTLGIEGQVDGNLRDALTVMQVAPIGTAEVFSGWRGEGPLSGTLKLNIPLAKGDRPEVAVDFSSSSASLFIAQADLQIDEVAGDFRYDSEQGFSARSFRGRTLDTTVEGKAVATGKPGSPSTRIEATGTVGLQPLLAWQKVEQPVPASGTLPLRLTLSLNDAENLLQLDSSLLGAELALPAPFGKKAGERRDTTLRMSMGGERQRYTVRHGSLAAATFVAPSGNWSAGGGELVLGGGAANVRTDQGLYVRGSVRQFDLGEWQAMLKENDAAPTGAAGVSLLRRAQFDIGTFTGFGTEVENLAVDLQRRNAGWLLGLQSTTVAGTVLLPDAEADPIALDLSRLRLPAADAGNANLPPHDVLEGVNPKDVPAVDIAVAELRRGEELLGAGSLKMRPSADGVVFSDLNFDLKGLKLAGAGGWEGPRTWYKGRLEGQNLADVLVAWGFAPSTTSENFHLDVDGSWPGSPAFFALNRFSGTLDARLRKGQLREVDGGAQALRIFGLLNFDSIGRRLRLDFSDLFSKGLSYDRIKAQLRAAEGVYQTSEPLTVVGPSSNLELDGQLDLVNDRIDAKLLVTLPVSNNLPLAALIVGAPAIGGALFVVDKLLGDKVARFATVQYNVEGPWQSPKITFDKPFEKPN